MPLNLPSVVHPTVAGPSRAHPKQALVWRLWFMTLVSTSTGVLARCWWLHDLPPTLCNGLARARRASHTP